MPVFYKKLVLNTRRVFPNTWDQARILAPDIELVDARFIKKSVMAPKGAPKDLGAVLYLGTSISKTKGRAVRYQVALRLYPAKSLEDVVDGNIALAKCKCTCPAFHYFVQYALWVQKALDQKPSRWAKMPSDVRNPKYIPSMCKHLLALSQALDKAGKIKFGI
jgi:hypothetical protein